MMYYLRAIAFVPVLLSLGTWVNVAATSAPALTPVLTATIELGKALSPITIPGGVRLVEPITGGNVTGIINATIIAGTATPVVVSSKTTNASATFAEITLYGIIDGTNQSFYVQEMGVGPRKSQITRLQIAAEGHGLGDALDLYDSFLLARTQMSADGKTVQVQGWIVEEEEA